MNLFILKIETRDFGILFHKFTNREEIEKYVDNPTILSYEIVKEFENLSYKDFTKLWRNHTAKEIAEIL